MTPLRLASIALVVLAVFDWVATVTLWRAARVIHEIALTERAAASLILTIAATAIGVLSLAYLLGVRLASPFPTLLLIVGLVLLSVPQLVWLAAYVRGKFR